MTNRAFRQLRAFWPKRAPDPKPTVYGVRNGKHSPLDANGAFADDTPYVSSRLAAKAAVSAVSSGGASGSGGVFDWLGTAEAVAGAVLGGASSSDDVGGDSMLKNFGDTDGGEGGSLLGDAQPFEYQPDTLSDEVIELAGSQGTPGNNQAQNKQTNNIARVLRLTPSQSRQLHDGISGEGLGYHEIMERAKDMFNLW